MSTNSRRKNRVCGAYPHTLYRFFTNREYAEQFALEGKLRVGLLDTYKKIECTARRDTSEGVGHYQLKGPVTIGLVSPNPQTPTYWIEKDGSQQHQTETGNSVFLLCCANTSANLKVLKSRLGAHVVKILSPVSLAIDLDYALNGEFGDQGPFLIRGCDVEYNKGALIEDGRKPEELTDLSYIQKPASFSAEKEFRFCLIAMGKAYLRHLNIEQFLEINLGTNPYYLQLMPE